MTFQEGMFWFISQRDSLPRTHVICPCENIRPLARQVQFDPTCVSAARPTARTIDSSAALLTP
jgi:hypothetical protein